VVEGILEEHKQDGTHSDVTADSVTTTDLTVSTNISLPNGSVTTAALADSAVTPAKLVAGTGSSWAWQSWTPTWANLTVSSSTVSAKFIQIGKTVSYRIVVILAGGNAPSGSVTFSLPVTSVTLVGTVNSTTIGHVRYLDAGTASFQGVATLATTTTATLQVGQADSTYLRVANLSSTVPMTWANTDEIHIVGTYEAA